MLIQNSMLILNSEFKIHNYDYRCFYELLNKRLV